MSDSEKENDRHLNKLNDEIRHHLHKKMRRFKKSPLILKFYM
jgi:hypothetical protein